MTTGIVIFARLDSTRLPGKVLMPLAGVPMLDWTIRRCRAASTPVMLATTDRTLDTPIADFAAAENLPVFRGDTNDVLGRALGAARSFGLDILVRVSGDSPFIDPAVIAAVIQVHDRERPELTTNVFPRTFPPGISAEALPLATLERLNDEVPANHYREHVTLYAYETPDAFRIVNVPASGADYRGDGHAGLHLAVDTPADYARAEWIARHLPSRDAGLGDIARLAQQHDLTKNHGMKSSDEGIVT
ncbi:MAG: spore coat protein [Magnetovibrio sp.]|nr:spore coat protein [Magnetovibrio sp.]